MMQERCYWMAMALILFAHSASAASLKPISDDYADNAIADSTAEFSLNSKMPLFDMARALLKQQAARTSEVLTVNLTNLIILLVVKAIIFGFGFIGSVGKRSTDSQSPSPFISHTDLMMMMGYALGSATDDYGCLYRTACDDPDAAERYMAASKLLLKGAKLFGSYKPDYEEIVYGLQEAIEYRHSGGVCSKQFTCKPMQ